MLKAMFRANERREGMSAAIFSLWRNWAVAVGLLTVLASLAPLVPRQWLASVNVVFYIILQLVYRELNKRDVPTCSRLNRQISAVMIVTALCLVVLYFLTLHGGELRELTGQPYDINSPLIVILITAPVATVVTFIYMVRRGEPMVCRQCRMRYGNVIEHGFVGDLYAREWRYQTRLLFVLSLGLSIVDWTYYMWQYVNVNLNRADLFFFVWMPLAIYIVSLFFLGFRYYSMWVYYCRNDEDHLVEKPGGTTLRYLVISDDKLLLNFYPTEEVFENGAKVKMFDTPAVTRTSYHENENLAEAVREFRTLSGISDADIRQAYSSPDKITYHNVFHYFAFLANPEQIADSKLEGEWFTWGNVMQLAQHGLLGRDLVSELKRVYNIAMTWKTYDEEGRRLYKIKHYRPTFRLRDLKNWSVDYNDYRWLKIARNNEDKFWYPLRRLFRRNLDAKHS